MVIVDIETFAIDDAEQYLTEPVSAPGNYKDQAKIDAYIADKRAEQRSRCALDPDLCRIVALGWCHDTSSVPTVHVIRTATEEADALRWFWQDTRPPSQRLITFNGHRFDLPVLMRRSLYLNVPHPAVNIDKYRSSNIDLYNYLTYNGAITGHSLQFYCARFGIPIDDVVTGKDIAALVAAGDWDAVAAHCRADVMATKALAARLGLLKPEPSMAVPDNDQVTVF